MTVKVICYCRRESLIPEQFCGEVLSCPNCSQRYSLPAAWKKLGRPVLDADFTPPSMLTLMCECGHRLEAPLLQAGQKVRCPKCAREKGVPGVSVPANNKVAAAIAPALPATQACPRCQAAGAVTAPYCATCGANFSTGLTHPDSEAQACWQAYQEIQQKPDKSERPKLTPAASRIAKLVGSRRPADRSRRRGGISRNDRRPPKG